MQIVLILFLNFGKGWPGKIYIIFYLKFIAYFWK